MKNLIIINGTMGVGKTTTCKKLNEALPSSVWLDGDWCWMMNPFIVNDETKKMVIDNITHVLRNFLNTSNIENIIFNWVLDREEIFEEVLNPIKDKEFNLYKFTLTCSEKELIKRIKRDIEIGLRDNDCINRSLERQELYNLLDTVKINTDEKTVEEVIEEIKSFIV